ncbi:MAG: threonylcarbamoyl-AMP synthase, partial [Synergistaceae bacterium]|nr:threonylcarbamoyl-AMP synthase [Synergistaceae bacterium]
MMTTTAKPNKWNPEPEIISQAAKIIRDGGLVAFPTETVYGLGADALNPEAVKKIYEAKGRPSDNPLILHVSNVEQVNELVFVNEAAEKLMADFWPAPLTLVMKAKNIIPSITRGGLDTAAIRMPNNPIALALIEAAQTPIAAPSANLSGRPSPTDFESVLHDMNGKIEMILDGGGVEVGIESTVIDITNPEKILMLRPGGMSREILEE